MEPPAGPVEPDGLVLRRDVLLHLQEVERTPVVLLLDLVGDLFQLGGGPVELPGHLDPQVGVPEHGIVVHGEVAVGRIDLTGLGADQGIHLGRTRIIGTGHTVEPGQQLRDLEQQLPCDAGAADEVPDLILPHAREDVDGHAGDLLRMGLRDLLDPGAAHGAEHEERRLGGVVDDQTGEILVRDRQFLLHEDRVHHEVLDPGAQQLTGLGLGFLRRVSETDAPQPGAARDPDLYLQHHRPAELQSDRTGLSGCSGHTALGDPDAAFLKQLFALVFE